MAVRGRRGGPRPRYRVRDWAGYDRALVRRGDITVWVSPEAVAGWRAPAGRRTFTDAAITAALTVRGAFRLALRQAEGLIRSVFGLLGPALPVPGHTTLSRRGRALRLDRCASAGGGLDLAIDSTGLRLAKPSGAGREGWRKLHIVVVPDTGQILAEELTRSDVHDTVPLPAMLGRITGRIGRVYGDAAYAGGPTYRAVAEHRQALPSAEGVFRPKAPDVRAADGLDPLTGRGRHARHVAREGRRAWERATGYGRRNAAEWTHSRWKRVLGGGLRSRSLGAQRAEARIAAGALNRMAELGMPRAVRVA
jgi:Transposase DDE domain